MNFKEVEKCYHSSINVQIIPSNSLQWLATTDTQCKINRLTTQNITWVSKHFFIPSRNLKAYGLSLKDHKQEQATSKEEKMRTQRKSVRSLIATGENAKTILTSALY